MDDVADQQQGIDLLRKYIDMIRGGELFEKSEPVILEALKIIENCNFRDITKIGNVFQDGIVIFDKDANILYVNKANEEMFGIPREECIGRNASEFVGDDFWISNATTLQVFSTLKSCTSITVPKRTGRQLLQTGVPICDENGDLKEVVIIDKDISELIRIKNKLDATQSQLSLTEEIKNTQEQMIDLLTNKTKIEGDFVFVSPQMQSAIEEAIQISKSDATVLILGETGCGKEIMADTVQNHSHRSSKPYIKVNCAAIPENLLESELFGYEAGAFTGAGSKGKAGMFELANHGTLLLDEIGELPLSFQSKLLRALQNRQIIRVGGVKNIELDVRIIASTNRDLKKMVADGDFREDLYYRINVLPVYIPPLRERPEDVDSLIRHYLQIFNKKYKKNIVVEPMVFFKLRKYGWPGNVRELENIFERLIVINCDNAVIQWEQIENLFSDQGSAKVVTHNEGFRQKNMAEIMDEYQREVLLWAASEYKTVREMAQALGVDHSTIVKKAKRLGIKFERKSGLS